MKKATLLILLCCTAMFCAAQTTIYVDSAATGANNGTSWTNAYTELSDALHYCWQTPAVDSVLVAKGTYLPGHRPYDMQPNKTGVETTIFSIGLNDTMFHIRTGLVVLGGYPGGGGPRDFQINECNLNKVFIDSADNWAAVNDTTILEGFYFGLGNQPYALLYQININGANLSLMPGELWVYKGLTRISNCKPANRYTFQDASFVTVSNSEFINLTPSDAISPLFIVNSTIKIYNCSFYGNIAEYGGSLWIENSIHNTVTIENCEFKNGLARYGGCFYIKGDGDYEFYNNTFDHCWANWPSVIFDRGGVLQAKAGKGNYNFKNNIFTDCVAGSDGGVLVVDSAKNFYFEKNVVDNTYSYPFAVNIKKADTFNCINNLFAKTNGGALQCFAGFIKFCNNTVYKNIGTPQPGHDPVVISGNVVDARNNLFYENYWIYLSHPNSYQLDLVSSAANKAASSWSNNFYYNDTSFQVCWLTYPPNITYPPNTVNDSVKGQLPKFINENNLIGPDGIWMTADDGLNINGNSPARNAGINSAVPNNITTDIKGDLRIFDTIVDIGAYESNGFLTPPIINIGPAPTATAQQFTATPCSAVANIHFGVNAAALGSAPTAVVNPGNIACVFDSTNASFSFLTPAIGTYTLSVFFNYGSTIKQTDSVFTIVAPTLITTSISASQNPSCLGDTVIFTATVTGNSSTPTYQWKVNGNNVGNNAATFLYSNGANNDTVSCAILPPACILSNSILSDTLIITVNQLPSVTASSSDSVICAGDSVLLFGSGANSYTWSGGVIDSIFFTPTNTQNYVVVGTDSNNCMNTDSINVNVDANQIPTVVLSSNPAPAIIGQAISFTAAMPGAISNYTIDWYVNGAINSSSNSPINTFIHTATAITDTVYCVLQAIGCYNPDSATSNKIGFGFPIGINEIENNSGLLIYPNPTNDKLNIVSDKDNIQSIVLTDLLGQVLIKKDDLNKKNYEVSLSHLANGMYHINIRTEKNNFVRKVQVLR